MDPHGSLLPALLANIPQERVEDVIVVRFADVAYPVGLNFLTARPGFEFLMVDELVEICKRIYGAEYWGPVLDMVLRHAAFAALEIGGTLVEMARILDDDLYRESIIQKISNPETRRFLQRLSAFREGMREHKVASTLHRLQRFLGTPFIRNIVGQARSTINFRKLMDGSRPSKIDHQLPEVDGWEEDPPLRSSRDRGQQRSVPGLVDHPAFPPDSSISGRHARVAESSSLSDHG